MPLSFFGASLHEDMHYPNNNYGIREIMTLSASNDIKINRFLAILPLKFIFFLPLYLLLKHAN